MSSIREQIITAFVSALQAGANPPGAIFRSRAEPLSAREHLPAFAVYPIEEDPSDEGSTITMRRLTVRVECFVAGMPPQDAALDPLLVYAVKTVFADANLAARLFHLEEKHTAWDFESSYEGVAAAPLDFVVTYATTRGDPEEDRTSH